MRFPSILLLCLLTLLAWPRPAHAASSYDNCAGFITSVPTVITTAGTWCLKQNLTTAITSGTAITIATDNVILDCNDFTLSGPTGGSVASVGVENQNATNNTQVRHCDIVGFAAGVALDSSHGGRNVVEDNQMDRNTNGGVSVDGDGGSLVQHNVISNSGFGNPPSGSYAGIGAGEYGTTDIIDNTITGVGVNCVPKSPCDLDVGIYLGSTSSQGANIIGNHISALHGGNNEAYGIYINYSGRVVIRDNEILGYGSGGEGIYCYTGTGASMKRVHHNIINGFQDAIEVCADAGENDVYYSGDP